MDIYLVYLTLPILLWSWDMEVERNRYTKVNINIGITSVNGLELYVHIGPWCDFLYQSVLWQQQKDTNKVNSHRVYGHTNGILFNSAWSWMILAWIMSGRSMKNIWYQYLKSVMKWQQIGRVQNAADSPWNMITKSERSIYPCQDMSKRHSNSSTMSSQLRNKTNHMHMFPPIMEQRSNPPFQRR